MPAAVYYASGSSCVRVRKACLAIYFFSEQDGVQQIDLKVKMAIAVQLINAIHAVTHLGRAKNPQCYTWTAKLLTPDFIFVRD